MRRLLTLLTAALLSPVPAAVAADSHPARVDLPACGQDSPLSESRVLDCTYIALAAKDGGTVYAHLTAPGAVTWRGTETAGSLTFPATTQSWPVMSLFNGLGSGRITPTTAAGTVTEVGQMALQLTFDIRISALGQQCMARGTVSTSSTGVDAVGGGQGKDRDPATGRFALAGTSAGAPELSGSACAQAAEYVDLSKGVGIYLEGALTVSDTASGGATGAQTAVLRTPAAIRSKGKTVLLPRAVRTNAGQVATASVSWSPRKAANGSQRRYATLTAGKGGKLLLTTTGKAKRLYVRLTVSAPPTGTYGEYLVTRRWVVR